MENKYTFKSTDRIPGADTTKYFSSSWNMNVVTSDIHIC
jgi:hypothetical protein